MCACVPLAAETPWSLASYQSQHIEVDLGEAILQLKLEPVATAMVQDWLFPAAA